MAGAEKKAAFRSADGTELRGTLRSPPSPRAGVLFVHGLTADRDEGGLYSRFAAGLDRAGAASLRFDLRAHGRSGGRQEDLTLSAVINDIGAAHAELSGSLPGGAPVTVVAASFGGGLSARWAAGGGALAGLVLLNPVIDYTERMLAGKPFWRDGALTARGAGELDRRGWLPHAGFRMGRALINELARARPEPGRAGLPLLVVHGDADSIAPYRTARDYAAACPGSRFVTVRGAEHGFESPGGDTAGPETEELRGAAIEAALEWIGAR